MKKSIHVLALCVALGLTVSACGSGNNGPGNAPSAARQNAEGGAAGGGPGGGGPGGGGPGGSGKVAAVSGSTAQVQGPGGQVAVTWTSATRFTQQVSATAKDLKVGDCVAAMTASPSSSDTSKVAAATVRISTPTAGSCTGGFRGQGDGTRVQQRGNPPQGAPSGQARRGGMGAFGKVTAIDGSGFSVESARPGSDDTATVSVTTSADTTWTASAKATSKDVKVGRCVASIGKPDSTGAITAASIAVSSPVNGQCAMTFGGPGRGGQGGEAQNS